MCATMVARIHTFGNILDGTQDYCKHIYCIHFREEDGAVRVSTLVFLARVRTSDQLFPARTSEQ
jgi:hypothetical protein